MRIRRALALTLLLPSLVGADTPKGAAEPEPGFTSLYRSGDPTEQGWEMVGPGSIKEESEGVLVTEGGMGMLWYSRRPFKNFVLKVDYQLSKPVNNSGVFVRFPNKPKSPWDAVNEGYEIQICEDAPPERRTGSVYSFKAAEAQPKLKPAGEWNEYEIRVEGQDYTISLNGSPVNTYKGSRGEQGFIGLQNHDDASIVRFRNVRIEELK